MKEEEISKLESKELYEKSYQEIMKIKKSIASDTVIIHFDNLDGVTKGELITAIQNVISKRQAEIDAVRLGVQ